MTYKPHCVLITGATGDFGRAFVDRFAAIGSKIIVHGRDAKKVDAIVKALKVPAYGMVCDITDTKGIAAAIDAIPDAFKDIDLLVNNAGGALGLEKAQEANLTDWDAMIDMNVRGLVHMTRHILPRMVAAKRGHIINIGSTAGNWPYPGGHVYCAAKAFVRQFSLAIRADLQGTHCRVTNVEPGMVETQFSLARFKGDEARAKSVYANTTPLKAEDIAEAVFWCATCPPHMNVNSIEIMPTTQSFSPLAVERFA
ncbi:MAG: SDR family NAD(P)-dependent oxidoreductase [Alphaproteobacteria bacterium]|nr:SDR family NAD(P)-dependent oxidoreductase [Alphaproteobacteria bacterium]